MATTTLPGDYLTPAQAAEALGRSTQRVRSMIWEGKLDAVITPLGKLIPRESVERLLAAREQVAG